ncbi:hypothetical protein ACYOEI_25680 [Singulisphaera rosea]
MIRIAILVVTICAGPTVKADVEGAHAANPAYRALLEQGLVIEGQSITLAPPRLRDGQSAEEQRKLVREIAGSERAAMEFLRDSVSAPFVLKIREESPRKEVLIRGADLWFAVRADLEALRPGEMTAKSPDQPPVEVGNMRFATKIFAEKELSGRGLSGSTKGLDQWYVHTTGRLLDRLHVEATNQVVATRATDSWVIASLTDPQFAGDREFPNRWWAITRKGATETPGQVYPYAGGASYVKISRLVEDPGTLLVESHFVFAEPRAWFDGAPILRSKISLIAQDQIRRLRRELAKLRSTTTGKANTTR